MAITDDPGSGGFIEVKSLVSAKTGEGVVTLQWGDKRGQLTPNEAREHALRVLEVAEAADTDAFLVEFLQKQAGASQQEALQTLVAFRAFREARDRENKH